MNRRQILLAGAAAVLVSPSAAEARRQRGDGFKTIPYEPINAFPYFTPGPELTAQWQHIDPLIRPPVKAINQSGWVWTAESCQGHHHAWSDRPMLRLVCRTADLGDLMGVVALSQAPADYMKQGTKVTAVRMKSPNGWSEIRVWAPDIAFFMRIARRL